MKPGYYIFKDWHHYLIIVYPDGSSESSSLCSNKWYKQRSFLELSSCYGSAKYHDFTRIGSL